MMTRVSFCPRCQKDCRPKTGQLFVAFGGHRDGYVVYEALHNGRKGFVPHTFEFKRLIGDTVHFNYACSMVGCGSVATPQKKDPKMYEVGFYWKQGTMPLKDWNALVKYKRDEDFEI